MAVVLIAGLVTIDTGEQTLAPTVTWAVCCGAANPELHPAFGSCGAGAPSAPEKPHLSAPPGPAPARIATAQFVKNSSSLPTRLLALGALPRHYTQGS